MRQNETETRSSRKRRLVAALIGAALVSGVALAALGIATYDQDMDTKLR